MCYQQNVRYMCVPRPLLFYILLQMEKLWPAFCLRTPGSSSVDPREATKPRKSFIVHFTLHHRLENCCFKCYQQKHPLRWCHAHFSSMYYLNREALACLLPMNSLRFYVDDREVVNSRKSPVGRFTLHHRLQNCCFRCYQQNVRYVGSTPTSLLCTT